MPGIRDVVSWPGALVPVSAARRIPWRPGRGLLLRAANDRLRRAPRRYERARTDVGWIVEGDTTDLIERYLYVFGTWEPSLSAFLRSHLRPGDVFVDIGANVGYFSLLAAGVVGDQGAVICVEPLPATVAKLRRNLQANGITNATVVAAVASDEPGEAEVFAGPVTNVGRSATAPGPGHASAGVVQRIAAADAIPVALWRRIGAIKVDVEGDELRVLRGLRPVLDVLPVGACVVAEVAPDRLGVRGGSSAELFDLMRSAGFRAAELRNDYHPRSYVAGRVDTPVPIEDPPSTIADVVFTKFAA